jgi:hypothetical protein
MFIEVKRVESHLQAARDEQQLMKRVVAMFAYTVGMLERRIVELLGSMNGGER